MGAHVLWWWLKWHCQPLRPCHTIASSSSKCHWGIPCHSRSPHTSSVWLPENCTNSTLQSTYKCWIPKVCLQTHSPGNGWYRWPVFWTKGTSRDLQVHRCDHQNQVTDDLGQLDKVRDKDLSDLDVTLEQLLQFTQNLQITEAHSKKIKGKVINFVKSSAKKPPNPSRKPQLNRSGHNLEKKAIKFSCWQNMHEHKGGIKMPCRRTYLWKVQ